MPERSVDGAEIVVVAGLESMVVGAFTSVDMALGRVQPAVSTKLVIVNPIRSGNFKDTSLSLSSIQ